MQVEDIKEYSTKIKRTEEEIAKGIIGQRNVIHHILLAILADGNVLLEGVPGLGKTQLVKTLAKLWILILAYTVYAGSNADRYYRYQSDHKRRRSKSVSI